jgi:hypothetical protein
MESENLISIDCPVCHMRFDHELREPRIFKNCGHSICHTCIMNFLNNMSSQHGIRVPCPVCRAEHFFTYLNNDQNIFFPKNYALISVMSLKKKERTMSENHCNAHGLVSSLLCFDGKCPKKKLACFQCLFEHHADCQKALMVDATDLARRVEYNDYPIDTTEFEVELRQNVRELITRLTENLTEQINSFMQKIKSVRLQIDLNDLESVEKNLGSLEVMPESLPKAIKLQPSNLEEVSKAADLQEIKNALKDLFIERVPLQIAAVFREFLRHVDPGALSEQRVNVVTTVS